MNMKLECDLSGIRKCMMSGLSLLLAGVLQAQNPIVKLAIVEKIESRKRNEEDHHYYYLLHWFVRGRLHNNGECSIIR